MFGFYSMVKWLAVAAFVGLCMQAPAPGQTPGRNRSDPADGNADKPGTIRFVQTNIYDASLNRVAATFLVPAGWKSEGGVMWFNSPFHPARPWVRSFNPVGLEQLTVYSMYDMFAGIRRAISSQARYWPEGSYYAGSEVRDVIANPGDFLKEIVIPRERKDIHDARIIGYEDLPKLADAVAQSPVARSVANLELRAGRLVVEYQIENKPVQEAFYCVLYFAPGGIRSTTLWGTQYLFSCRAEKGHLDEQARFQYAMAFSQREDIGWWNVMDQIRQMRIHDEYRKSEKAMEFSRYITRVNDEINDMRRQSFEYRGRVTSDANRRFCETIRGVNSYETPFENYPVQLPNGYDYVWTSGSGQYVMSNDPGFIPGQHFAGTWQSIHLAR